MNVTVVGTGYVGLVTGTCLAEMGSQVYCVDTDTTKISNLENGILPIYEPGLEPLVVENHRAGRLSFSTSLSDAMQNSDLIFIAVGTPPGEDGSADLQYVLAVADEIGTHLDRYSVIVDKSTVPVGTADKVKEVIQARLDQRAVDTTFDVVSNPEFLKEGAAVDDFMRPDRIILGANSDRAIALMHELYAPFTRNHDRMVVMNVRDAEMTKYAANAMLATKISFMNEIANLCDRLDVDVENVRKGIGSDTRIGYSFIYPGAGYGGSCFPKDVKALIYMAEQSKFDPLLLNAVERRNEKQKHLLFEKIVGKYGNDLSDYHFGLWGLAFKPGTDDMREAPSKVLLSELINAGATVTAYDPEAMGIATGELPDDWFDSNKLMLVEDQYAALDKADALILITEWKPFRRPDLSRMKTLMKTGMIFDGRNQYDPVQIREAGFDYIGIGR